MNYLKYIILLISFYCFDLFAACGLYKQGLDCGVKVYQERCVLCHGRTGLGDGLLALAIKHYPDTNLLKTNLKFAPTIENINKSILYGGTLSKLSNEMPPWNDELTVLEAESVTELVFNLITNLEITSALLRSRESPVKPSLKLGRIIFSGRCVLCHGKFADGKGKMSKIIKNPPPFNLLLSVASDSYLRDIINKGGEAMKRSPRMPPWSSDLNSSEIDSLIIYLKSIRVKQ